MADSAVEVVTEVGEAVEVARQDQATQAKTETQWEISRRNTTIISEESEQISSSH